MSTQTQEEWDRLHGSQYDAEEDVQADRFTWKVLESKVPGYERVISVVADGNLGVCRLDGGGSSNPKVLEDVRAKARLIAASPALYEAAKLVLGWLEISAMYRESNLSPIKELRAAIELAKKGEL